MNATLTFAVDLDDIPKELSQQLDYVHKELVSVSRNAYDAGSALKGDPEGDKNVLTDLHNLRVHMAKIDQRLEDCMSILGGYVDYLENPPPPPADEPDEEALEEGADEEEKEDDEG
tara:strand:- start:576 stop:923 length:348 start_codon:yes stop_codon:yes gene_type:complete